MDVSHQLHSLTASCYHDTGCPRVFTDSTMGEFSHLTRNNLRHRQTMQGIGMCKRGFVYVEKSVD